MYIKGTSSLVFPRIISRASLEVSYSTTFFLWKCGLGSVTNFSHHTIDLNFRSCGFPSLTVWYTGIAKYDLAVMQTIFVHQRLFICGLMKDNSMSKSRCFHFNNFFLGKCGSRSVTNPSHPDNWPKLWIMWLSLINNLIYRNCKVWPCRKLLQTILYIKSPSSLVFPRIISKASLDASCSAAFFWKNMDWVV